MDAVDIDTADEVDQNDDTIEETVPEVCRVCLLGHVIMRDLFVENEIVSLSTKAMSFASVKMLPEDGLPAQVCCECADKLDAAYEFKLQVEQADNVLRQRYDTLNIKEELFFNEVEVHLEGDRDGVHSLDVDAHYQATVDSLNAVEAEEAEKPSLLKDHLALLAVEKLAKQQNALGTGGKEDEVIDEDAGVSHILHANDHHDSYMHDNEENVDELPDCDQNYEESIKAEGMHDPDAITAEEHNYIMQQGYALTRNEEALVVQESVDSVGGESVHYLSLMDEEMNVKEGVELDQTETEHSIKLEEQQFQEQQQPQEQQQLHEQEDQHEQQEHQNDEESTVKIKTEILPSEARRSKRKLSKKNPKADEESYFENLNLSSRLKRSQIDKSDKFYFLCYLCDKEFVSKEILKEHMHSHVEVRRALSLQNDERVEKAQPSSTKSTPSVATPMAATTTTTMMTTTTTTTLTTTPTSSPIASNVLSGKKANKCPYCGKEYLYVISYNKHVKQHEKNREATRDSTFGSQDESVNDDCSSDIGNYEEERNAEMNSRIEVKTADDNVDENDDTNDDPTRIIVDSADTSPTRRKRRRRSLRNDKTTYSCDKCPEKFTNRRSLVEHANEHIGNFRCNTCEREFEDLEKLRRHRAEHVVEGVLSEQDLEDDAYEREFESEKNRDNESHPIGESTEIQNGGTIPYREENDVREDAEDDDGDEENDENYNEEEEERDDDDGIGGNDEDNSWKLELEEANEDTKDDIGTSEISDTWSSTLELKCPDCDVTCTSKRSLARHIESHGTSKEICKLCKMEFSRKEQLHRHVEQIHRVKSFKCTECNKIFGNELTLRNHLFATNHKTIVHGQQYDPNKRIKRVAAKAAQKIIDKIKSEDDYDEYEDDNEKIKEERVAENSAEVAEEDEHDEETLESRNSQIDDGRWSRREKKFPRHRNRRRRDYECEYCGRKCSSKQSLSKHVVQHRVKDVKIDGSEKSRRNEGTEGSCEIEGQVGTSATKNRDERIDDDTADDNSDFESGLDWPIDNHECPTCKKKYSTKKSLMRHQLLHEEPNFECDICNVKFYRKDKLKSHYDKCSEKNPDQVRKCNICGEVFENNELLKEHRGRHVDEGILTEEDLRDIEPGGIEDRRESSKIARKRRTDIVGLECPECNKRYTSRKGLLRHILVHEGKKYLCDICPKKFYRREHLKIHVAKHNMIKPYKCPRCTKRFIKEEQLASHLSKHDRTFKKPKETDTSKRFLCEICSKSFTQSTTLIAHLRVHNGIKPYVCEVCARPFTTNAYLKMHMRTHTQERPYSCQYCSRAFARADTLANHLTSHTGEAKYHCKYCPKNFRRLKSLKEHVFIHTGQRPYACPTCDRRFNNNGSRYAHSKRCKQNLLQTQNRTQTNNNPTTTTTTVVNQNVPQPIRLHQLTSSEHLIEHPEHGTQMQLVKSTSIKTITIARPIDQMGGVMQHQDILMPLILPLTVTLTDSDDEVILPENTKIFTTA